MAGMNPLHFHENADAVGVSDAVVRTACHRVNDIFFFVGFRECLCVIRFLFKRFVIYGLELIESVDCLLKRGMVFQHV